MMTVLWLSSCADFCQWIFSFAILQLLSALAPPMRRGDAELLPVFGHGATGNRITQFGEPVLQLLIAGGL